MKLNINQKNVIFWMIKYLKLETTEFICDGMADVKYTLDMFKHIYEDRDFKDINDHVKTERLNWIRDYYLERLKRDIK